MNGRAWGVVCVIAGLSMAFAGYKLSRSQELPEGASGFSGFLPNRRGLLIMLGNGLLITGLILAVVISSFFFIGG